MQYLATNCIDPSGGQVNEMSVVISLKTFRLLNRLSCNWNSFDFYIYGIFPQLNDS
jgi:hypothetical protein